jgi:hypothetical protein
MMSKTFDKDSEDTHRIWIFPFANLVLRYEHMLSVCQQAHHRSGIAATARFLVPFRSKPFQSQERWVGFEGRGGGD